MTACPCCGQPVKDDTQLLVDLNTNSAARGDVRVHLSPAEAEILEALHRRAPGTLTFDNAFDAFYGKRSRTWEKYTNPMLAMRVRMSKLRKKLVPLRMQIDSVHGVGWRLVTK